MKTRYLLFLAAVAVLLVTTPPDLFKGDQEKQVGYVMDLLHGGSWALQYEVNGTVASKPPLYNWCAAGLCRLTGSTAPWVMKLPSLLAAAGLLYVLWRLGKRLLSPEAAAWAVVAAAASHHFGKLSWFARTDMLMAFLLFLAILLTVEMRPSVPKVFAVGLTLGLCFLAKGPVGPALYLLWLALWAWHQETWRSACAWTHAIVAGVIAVAVMLFWLGLVWDMPMFQEGVLGRELGGRFVSETGNSRPVYYYIPILFARIAPWPLLAIGGILAARRRGKWRQVRFLALWAGVFFVFFSLIPSKRHDLLLPVYPPVFLLAGYAVERLLRADASRWVGRSVRALGWVFVAGGAYILIESEGQTVFLVLGTLAALAGAMAALAGGRHLARATLFVCGGLALGNATYLHGLGQEDEVEAYHQLRVFTQPLREAADQGRVTVWRAHPLISYELGIHQREIRWRDVFVPDVAASPSPPRWLICDTTQIRAIPLRAGWTLREEGRLVIEDEGVDARLLAVMAPGR